jgi:hypothetical protein
VEQIATLSEIETHWSIDDIADANEVLDAWHAARARAAKRG